jgi:hypothetical protein
MPIINSQLLWSRSLFAFATHSCHFDWSIMSMGWDNVSEPPSRSYMNVVNHGEMMPAGENTWLVHQSSLAFLQAESSNVRWRTKAFRSLSCKHFVHTCKWFFHTVKSYDVGPSALLPIRRKACCDFLTLEESIASAGFETSDPFIQWQHDNHYTTEATTAMLISLFVSFNVVVCNNIWSNTRYLTELQFP